MHLARKKFEERCGPPPRGSFMPLNGSATITGVAFFDVKHSNPQHVERPVFDAFERGEKVYVLSVEVAIRIHDVAGFWCAGLPRQSIDAACIARDRLA
jgi:hypothetical protein